MKQKKKKQRVENEETLTCNQCSSFKKVVIRSTIETNRKPFQFMLI